YAQEQGGVLASMKQNAVARNALNGQDRARDWTHSGTLVAYSLDNNGIMRAFEPAQDTLEAISQAGHTANASGKELIYDLRSETTDPVVLAVRKAWSEGANRQAQLPAENRNPLSLLPPGNSPFENYAANKALMQDGTPYLAEDLRNAKRTTGVTYLLTADDLRKAGLEAGDGKVLIRPAGLGDYVFGSVVDAIVRFYYGWLSRAVAVVGASQISTGK
ncbi:MAG: hypothetical protein Q8R18_01350, partial [bacterium]|nr:hypothetical protein [bacterium]